MERLLKLTGLFDRAAIEIQNSGLEPFPFPIMPQI
jgi:hypothetical protein